MGEFTIRPGSVAAAAVSGKTPNERTNLPLCETVKLGINSSVRSTEMPSSPVICPAWLRLLEMLRANGIQESSSRLKR